MYINGDPGLTLTYFMAGSNLVAGAFKCGGTKFDKVYINDDPGLTSQGL